MPYRRRPPIRSAFSNTVTAWPARFSCCAAASPDGPEPTIAILLPVRVSGSSGLIHPSSQARSTIVFSITLIVTGGSLMPRTHAASRRAGISRVYSLNPVTLPTEHLPLRLHLLLGLRDQRARGYSWNAQNTLIFVREYFDESRQ